MSYEYGKAFFEYQQIGSLASARSVVPFVLRHLKPISVLDVGCGAGAWVTAYAEAGAADVIGVDAGYVPKEQLLFDVSRFRAIDVASSFRLGRTFDLVQCLEVAEHLDPCASETLVDNLVAHAPIVVFSAAPPGQGGEHHINERPYEFWRDLFEKRSYSLFDFLRPRIRSNLAIERWYRYNMLVFVRDDAFDCLEPAVAASRVDPRSAVPDLSPISWRIRRRMLSVLPPEVVTRMASVKHSMVLRRKGRGVERVRVEPS
jgi:SAM-dependent methyltransferase